MLLPRCDERSDAGVVDDRRPSRREREPAAGALTAAQNRPCGRRTAALAEGSWEAWDLPEAPPANVTARDAADDTPPRKDEIQEVTERHMTPR